MNEPFHDYLLLLGYQLLRYGKTRRAIAILEALVVLQPQNIAARRTLSYALLAAGEYERSLEELEHVVASGRNESSEQLIRVRALWGLERHPEAREIVQQLNGRLRSADG